jgi:hypothetical protein
MKEPPVNLTNRPRRMNASFARSKLTIVRMLLIGGAISLCAALAFAELADVYLKNGLKLRGDVTVTETEVVVRNNLGEARYPKDQVERIVPVAEPTSRPAASPTSQPATRPTTRPTAQPGKGAEAGPEPAANTRGRLPRLPALSAHDIQRLKLAELRLDGAAENVRVQFGTKAEQNELAKQVLAELRDRTDYRKEWEDILLHGQPHEKLRLIVKTTGNKYADRITVTSDPEVFANFRTHVLPLVARGCAKSGCHSGNDAAVFRFPDGSAQNEAYMYLAFYLLDRLETRQGPLIDRDNPGGSVLLGYMLPQKDNSQAHPEIDRKRKISPVLRGADNAAYKHIVDWINSLRVPHPDYELDYQFPFPIGRSEERAPREPSSTQPVRPKEGGVPAPAERPTTAPGAAPDRAP